jgi:hypothetical protein
MLCIEKYKIPLDTVKLIYFAHIRSIINGHGHGGPITWLPCSSDLAPLDFYLWRYMECLVYATQWRHMILWQELQ